MCHIPVQKHACATHTQNTSSKESPSAPSNRQTVSALCARSPKSASHKSWGAYCTEATATATGRRVRTVVCAFANSHSAGTRPELFRLNRARVLAAFRRVCACVRVSFVQLLPRHDNDDDVLASVYLSGFDGAPQNSYVCVCTFTFVHAAIQWRAAPAGQ